MKELQYLSLCSGIEAATVAWHILGWKPAAFSEIDPFAKAVLKHHYPNVPNLGDLKKYREWPELASSRLLQFQDHPSGLPSPRRQVVRAAPAAPANLPHCRAGRRCWTFWKASLSIRNTCSPQKRARARSNVLRNAARNCPTSSRTPCAPWRKGGIGGATGLTNPRPRGLPQRRPRSPVPAIGRHCDCGPPRGRGISRIRL